MVHDIESIETMIRAARRIMVKTRGVSFEQFKNNEDLLDICAVQCQIMGNNADGVSTALQLSHPEVDWDGLYGLRCVIAHIYGSDSFSIVKLWNSINIELPPLIENLEAIRLELLSGETTSRNIRRNPTRRLFSRRRRTI